MRAKRTTAASLRSAVQPSPQGRGGRGRAFTLTELLIVIAIMILLLSVAVPTLSSLLNTGRGDSALGALGAGIATARSYATRHPPYDVIGYKGTALIVTPANELRIVEHHEYSARNDADPNDWLGQKAAGEQYGYRDIPGEPYIRMPKGVGLVGIARHTAGAPHLLAPPFALRFDQNGHLIVMGSHAPPGGDAGHVPPYGAYERTWEGHIYYDGQYEGRPGSTPVDTDFFDYNFGGIGDWPYTGVGNHPRDNGYDPATNWDHEFAGKTIYDPAVHGAFNFNNPQGNFHKDEQKYMLPFDAIETVIGVIAFNKQSLYDQFGRDALKAQTPSEATAAAGALGTSFAAELGNLRDWRSGNPDGQKVRTWLFENGRVMFFNRYSGAIIKP